MTKQTEALKMALETYLCREMPAGTVIGDPKWWAPKIAAAIKEALAQPEQEPVAIHQHRIPYCADWYDGIPDHHDGHGPYEVRTLYTTPPKRPWVGLTEKDFSAINQSCLTKLQAATSAESILKKKNT